MRQERSGSWLNEEIGAVREVVVAADVIDQPLGAIKHSVTNNAASITL